MGWRRRREILQAERKRKINAGVQAHMQTGRQAGHTETEKLKRNEHRFCACANALLDFNQVSAGDSQDLRG